MKYEDIIKKIKFLSNPRAIKGMSKYGITPEKTYGVSIPNLRKLAKEIGKNHKLAEQLWSENIRETRILASMIEDLEMVTEGQMENWVREFDYWEICDQCCMNLFERTEFAYEKAMEWSVKEAEFIKRSGFVLMARLAVSDKKAEDGKFIQFFPDIKRAATDNRNYVRKAVSWALRQIGKRNLNLNSKAIKIAKDIQKMDSRSAKWIASDVLRELTSEAVRKRLLNL